MSTKNMEYRLYLNDEVKFRWTAKFGEGFKCRPKETKGTCLIKRDFEYAEQGFSAEWYSSGNWRLEASWEA